MLLWGRLIWRRRKTWTTRALVRHDTTEQTTLTVTERWRWLRGPTVLQWTADVGLGHGRSAAAHVELMAQSANLVLVVLLDLQLVLFQLIDLVPNELHLLDLLGNLALKLLRAAILIVELCAQGIKDFIEAVIRLPRRGGP